MAFGGAIMVPVEIPLRSGPWRPNFFFIRSRTEYLNRPDRIATETIKGPFWWTDGLGPVRLTKSRSVFVEP